MPVVPAHELRCRVAAGEILAVESKRAIGFRAIGEQDCVMCGAQLRDAYVAPDRHIAEEPEVWCLGDLVESRNWLLELGVIGRDSISDKSERHRQPLQHIDANFQRRL